MDLDFRTRPTSTAVLLLAIAAAGVLAYRLLFHPLSRFPGPRLWAMTRLPWLYHTSSGRLFARLAQLHEQYGPVVRTAPGELSICSPTAWSDIYVSRPIMPKEPTGQTPPLNGAHSLFTAVGADHRRIRGAVVAGFSDKALREMARGVEFHVDQFIARLKREIAQQGNVLDLHKFFGFAALDTITDLSYSGSMHVLADRNENDMIEGFFLHARFSTLRACLAWCYPLDKILDFLVLTLKRRQRSKNWAVFGGKIEARIDGKHEKGEQDWPDLLTPVLERTSTGSKAEGRVTRQEILSHTLASVIANSQLTSYTLAATTYLLLSNPPALKHAVQEIRSTFSSPDQITVASTQGLVYLSAVLNETMRLQHPTPSTLPRVVPPEGKVIDGISIPGNTIVGMNLHVMHTSPKFWVDPQSFHPERFLDRTDERYDPRFDGDVKTAFMPFSTGPRNCIGGKFFFTEAKTTLARLLYGFEMQLEGDTTGWLEGRAYIIYEPKQLWVRISEFS
ncbi:cytochrome P450 [Aspergillus unguis]